MTYDLIGWARHQVSTAIRQGVLVRPDRCEVCGEKSPPMKDGRSSIQAHHHKGYEAALDVQWLCVACHRKETPSPYGTRAYAAKLDWPQVDAIRARYESGESYYKIADEIGLARTTIHKVVTHRTWPNHARPAAMKEA